jgi:hypothetical protein
MSTFSYFKLVECPAISYTRLNYLVEFPDLIMDQRKEARYCFQDVRNMHAVRK